MDLETGAIVTVTLQPANAGDTTTLYEILLVTADNLAEVANDTETSNGVKSDMLQEVVADKRYHSNATIRELEICSYDSEPKY